jgi:broad specificity phosphatase PhoE
MTAVYVLRHPETTWNVEQRYQGRLDTPLSERGCRQVEQLGRSFAGASLDTVITSPLQRARCLAEAIAGATSSAIRVDQRLTEMAQGPWEGMYLRDIHRLHRDLYERWYSRPDLVKFPGGEDLSTVQDRALSVMGSIFREYLGGSVAIVTHSVIVQVIAAVALSLDLRNLHNVRVANGSVTTLCGPQLPGSMLTLNSTEALYGIPASCAAAHGCTGTELGRRTT